MDKEGAVYVVDSGNHRVIKYVATEEELNRGKDEKQQAQEPSKYPAPRDVIVKAGDTEAFLSWMDVPGAVSYNVYFNTQPDLTIQSATKIEGVTSPYNHSGLTNDTAYFYAITAVYEDEAESVLSKEVTAIPVLIDITAPQTPNAVINHGAFMTNSPEIVVTISANDLDTGVASYFISESPMTPMAGTPGWVEVTPALKFGATVPFILSLGDGQKTIYVWFKDVGNNISTPASATILINTSGYLCVSKWGKPGRGASLLHGGEFMAPHIWSHHRSARQHLCRRQRQQPGTKVRQYREFHHPLGKFRFSQFQFSQSDRHCVRREGRCLCRRYQQSSGSEIRRQARRVHHEIRFARER